MTGKKERGGGGGGAGGGDTFEFSRPYVMWTIPLTYHVYQRARIHANRGSCKLSIQRCATWNKSFFELMNLKKWWRTALTPSLTWPIRLEIFLEIQKRMISIGRNKRLGCKTSSWFHIGNERNCSFLKRYSRTAFE